MRVQFKISLIVLMLSLFSTWSSTAVATTTASSLPEKATAITLTSLGGGMHQLSWSAMTGTGNYTVTVYNQSTQTVHTAFNISSTSAVLSGLVTGNTYNV